MSTRQSGAVVYEYVQAQGLDFTGYCRAVGLPFSDIRHTLKLSPAQLQRIRDTKNCPKAVWLKALRLWGRMGFHDPKYKRIAKPYRLHPMYAEFPGIVSSAKNDSPEPAPELPPELPPEPLTVPWDIYVHTVNLLQHQNGQLIEERAHVDTYVRTLEQTVAVLKADRGLEDVLAGFERKPTPIPTAPTKTPQVVETLRTLSHINGNGKVLQDLETRLGKLV